jgi:hypothetical protein
MMMYDVWTMRRTNIYLDDGQLAILRRLGESRGQPVAELIRQAVDHWLAAQNVRAIPEDEWERRFDRLLARRRAVAAEIGVDEAQVERDVQQAVRDWRKARAARRR